MKQDIILCGVGGQGILSIAYVLDNSAQDAGFHFKQPEVHGMAQRGGAVHAQLRISDQPVASALIPAGSAGMMLSLEPMESLRYLSYMSPQASLITDINPHINIDHYPDLNRLYDALFRLPKVLAVDGMRLAKKCGLGRAQNMIILGTASSWLPFESSRLEKHIAALFGAKDQRMQQLNLKAFCVGQSVGRFYRFMIDVGLPYSRTAKVAARLDFDDRPTAPAVLEAWKKLLSHERGDELADQIFKAQSILPLTEETSEAILGGVAPAYLAVNPS